MMKGGHGPCKLTSIYYYSSYSVALCISYHIKGSHDSVANRVMNNILYAVNVSHTHTHFIKCSAHNKCLHRA